MIGLFGPVDPDEGSLGDCGHGTFRQTASYHVRLHSGQTITVRTDDGTRIRAPGQHSGDGLEYGPRRAVVALKPMLSGLVLGPTMADVTKTLGEVDSMLSTMTHG